MNKKSIAGFVGLVAALAFATIASAAVFTTTLTIGSTGAEVTALQVVLNSSVDTQVSASGVGSKGMETAYFGTATQAAVIKFQIKNGVSGTGVVGPLTRAVLNAMGGSVATTSAAFTAGCTSAAGFSSTTGLACAAVAATTLPAGCASATGFSSTTGKACVAVAVVAVTLPAGCASATGFSSTTGAKCDSTATAPATSGALTGGAGDADITNTTTDTEGSLKEGEKDVKVLGFQVEAIDSDVMLTNLKISLENTGSIGDDDSSEALNRYIDEVTVWMGSTKVGSADASDFSRKSGDADIFTKSIALKDAIVREDKKVKFYVAVTANSTIDTDDMTFAVWTMITESLRFVDATGAILTGDLLDVDSQPFDFKDADTDDDLSVKTSSSDPAVTTFKVKDSDTSDKYLAFAFKLDVDEDSSDITINELPIYLEIGVNTDDGGGYTDIESIIDAVTVKIGSTTYEATLGDEGGPNADFNGITGTVTYMVDFDGDAPTIDAGSFEDVKVYIEFNEQDTNYDVGTTVQGLVTGANIAGEGTDELTASGNKSGKVHTLALASFTIAKVSATQVYVPSEQTDIAKYTLVFSVTNTSDEDLYLPFGAIVESLTDAGGILVAGDDAEGLSFVFEDSSGGIYDAADGALSISVEADNADTEGTNAFLIASDETENFTLTVTIDNVTEVPGSYRLHITGAIAGSDDLDGTGVGANNVFQSFSNVRTNILALTS